MSLKLGLSNLPGLGMALMLTFTGSMHFIAPRTFDSIVPKILPGDARLWTYLSGIAELIVALLLVMPSKLSLFGISLPLLGAYCAFALFIAVFPANINMAWMWRHKAMPAPLLAYARLPLQFGLFYWALAIAKSLKR